MPIFRAVEAPFAGSFYRRVENFTIPIPPLAIPTLSELRRFGVTSIVRDDSPTEAVKLELGTILLDGETHVMPSVYTARVAGIQGLLGLQHGIWIIENQNREVLAPIRALRCKIYIDLRGILVTIGPSKFQRFPYLSGNAERWGFSFDVTGGFSSIIGRLAVASRK